jgi:hypothetical protein
MNNEKLKDNNGTHEQSALNGIISYRQGNALSLQFKFPELQNCKTAKLFQPNNKQLSTNN